MIMALALVVVSGCNPAGNENAEPPSEDNLATTKSESAHSVSDLSTNEHSDSDHEHVPGTHGGIIVSLGRDSYHVEAVVDSEGSIRLYTLGKDESRVIDVESQTLKGFVKANDDTNSRSIDFEPAPQEGDSEGKTSLFVGQLPTELIGKKIDVTIPNVRINGERFRLGFVSGEDNHASNSDIPAKVASDTERDLYLTPGGRYTAADIAANGNMTASQKFKGLKSEHNMKPNVGDKLCPISGTKANSKFTWIIDGKPFEFCCPPCVDEFLANAKNSDDPLPEPDSFIKK